MIADLSVLVGVALAALGLGALNTWALHATVRRLVARRGGAWLAVMGGILRLAVVAGVLVLLAGEHAERWAAALVGLLLARGLYIRLAGRRCGAPATEA